MIIKQCKRKKHTEKNVALLKCTLPLGFYKGLSEMLKRTEVCFLQFPERASKHWHFASFACQTTLTSPQAVVLGDCHKHGWLSQAQVTSSFTPHPAPPVPSWCHTEIDAGWMPCAHAQSGPRFQGISAGLGRTQAWQLCGKTLWWLWAPELLLSKHEQWVPKLGLKLGTK